jgi:hypothetical protein
MKIVTILDSVNQVKIIASYFDFADIGVSMKFRCKR